MRLFVLICSSLAALDAQAQVAAARADGPTKYLLARRAGRPEKNYYELTQKAQMFGGFVTEEMARQYKPSPRNYGADVITDNTVRYGVYQAWKVRIVATSDSQNAPASIKESIYVLSYPRNPDWKFAAKKYNFVRTSSGSQKLTYTDFQSGGEQTIALTADWPRPWTVYEVEVLSSNAFPEIWQAATQRKPNSR